MSLLRIVAPLFVAALICPALPAQAEEVQRMLTIVALGDSITAGTPAFRSPLESPPDGAGDKRSQYAYWIMKQNPTWTVINQGINGQRTDQILARFDTSVLAHRPHIVVVLAGVNDLYQGMQPEQVIKNLEKIYLRAQTAGIRVITCSILPYNGMSPTVQSRMMQVNLWIENYSRDKGFQFCDLYHVMEDPFKPGRLRSSAPDGLHPDVEGYRRMGQEIAKAIGRIQPSTESSRAGGL